MLSLAFVGQPANPSAAPTQVNPAGPPGPAGQTGPAGAAGRDGVDGAPGRDGIDGAGTIGTRIAAQSIPPSTFIVDNGDGTCSIANPNNAAHKGRVLGLVAVGVAQGAVAGYVSLGAVAGVVGTFAPTDGTLFIGDGVTGAIGSIVNVSPGLTTAAWIQTVGSPVSATSVNVQLGEAGLILTGSVPVFPPTAGRGVSGVTVDGNGHLIVTYTDGTTADAGPVPTSPGRGVAGVSVNTNGHLIVTYTDGTNADAGPVPTPGAGRGIASTAVDGNGHLIITYTDGTTADAGALPTPAGIVVDGGTF